jgi:hypothetical protein
LPRQDKKTREEAKKTLVRDLTEALRQNLGQYAEDKAASIDIRGVPANPDDPSISASATDKLEHHDTIRGMVSRALPSCARGYIRIIPAGSKNGIPSVSEIANIPFKDAVQPRSEGSLNGDFGFCEEGYVRYWLTGKASDDEFETRDVAMWFEETGEFWVIHGTAIDERGHKTLSVPSLPGGWYNSLYHAMAIFDRFGALPVRKVEAGLTGVRGVMWPNHFVSGTMPARRGQCVHVRQRRDWNDEAQLEFLTEAYNKVRDLFSLPRASRNEVRRLLQA